ncbi:hypothetical protein MAA_11839 [Metarhizium robertsii ARSEF 23]|nr:uncharacterized protein MAA_11839 [Metarhizium robertsii ARSEF 23]KHO10560.1 hypothetical protein MAA_11839 [Metarhizium robertsii ARSEF 23]
MDQAKQEIPVKMKQEGPVPTPVPTPSSQSPTDDEREDVFDEIVVCEDVVDLSEMEDPLHDLVFCSIPGDKGREGLVDDENEVGEEDGEEVLGPGFVRDSSPHYRV